MTKKVSGFGTWFSLGLLVLWAVAAPATAQDGSKKDTTAALEAVIGGDHRTPEEKARDQYRHPLKTLQFFGIEPDMTVVEVYPGGGWYTKILAPFLKDAGTYYAAIFPPAPDNDYVTRARQNFIENFAEKPGTYGDVNVTVLDPSGVEKIAPDGAADMVLTFRNVHSWMGRGFAETAFQKFFDALKPGGVLGVVEHRAREDRPQDTQALDGYVRQDYVVKLATEAGFRLVGQSEINANPKDTKDHPKGVWTLPPSLALGDKNREDYLAIGESDRMTLKFMKPPANGAIKDLPRPDFDKPFDKGEGGGY